MKKDQNRCDKCGKFVLECSLLADDTTDMAICKKCWKKAQSSLEKNRPATVLTHWTGHIKRNN